MKRTAAAPLVLLAALLGAAPVGAAEVHEFQLDNGMKVLVRADQRAPVVVSQVWYRVGSVDEHRGITGISHVLEHMMFKGTDDYGPGEMSEVIARHGGQENAFTSHDYTAYYQQVAAEHLGLMLELEADRMTDLTLAPEQFQREVRVVQEERRQRVEDQPRSLTYERLRAAAFPSSPTRTPIIGWRADLESMTAAEVERWYQQWYAPNNAALVVVGDVDPQRVLALAREHFGDKERVDLPRRPAPSEVEPRGEIRLEVHAPATVPYLAMGWRVPSLTTVEDEADVYALDVLVGILDGGRSARIESNIVRGSGVASGAGASYSPLARTETLFTAGGTPAQGRDVAALEQALRDEIERLKSGEIGAAELERVKTNVRASDVFQRDSMFYQAMRIGRLETVGVGQEAYDAYQEGIRAVTAADVRRVARTYLTDQRLTVARLVPEGVDDADGRRPADAGPIEGESIVQ
ncbi:MAG: pitrilysin family protein [Halofilum sp. (in: g-proteobacteria)]|nr:pitrilysin family protein [Halofilum sp. (in: g-proteobacteria)]